MKVRAIQCGPVLGDLKKNFEFHKTAIETAKKNGIDLIIFPELSLSGYDLKDIVYDIALKPDSHVIKQLADLSQGINIIVGAPYEEKTGVFFNCGLYFSQGQMKFLHRKVQLPNFGMFEEEMIFKSGQNFKTFDLGGYTAGILICREILFPINAYLYYLQNTDFLIAISNSPFRGISTDKFSSLNLWQRLGEVYSINFHMNYVFVNRSGFEAGMGFGGGSFFAAPGKGIVKSAAHFKNDTLDFEINLDQVRQSRIAGNYLRDEKPRFVLEELKRILND